MVVNNNKKTEVQLRNEREVRRIMEERGYSSASSKKQIKKTFDRGFYLKPFIAIFLVIGLLAGGWVFIQNNPLGDYSEDKQNEHRPTEKTTAKENDELIKFQACLGQIDMSDISFDDTEFWDKYTNRYEQILACYNSHPSVADSSEKEELQNKLVEIQESSKQVDANNIEYRANIAQIDAELERKLAKIKEDEEAWDAELLKRVQERQAESAERNAQYTKEQAEREAKQAKCNEFKTQFPDVDTYKARNGNLDELYNNWQSAQSAYYSAVDSYNTYMTKYSTKHSEEYLARQANLLDEKKAEMDAAHNAWSSSNANLSNEYNNKYREACL